MAASWLHPPVDLRVRPRHRRLPQHSRACMCDMRIAAAHVSVQLSYPPSHPFDGRWYLQARDPDHDREQVQEHQEALFRRRDPDEQGDERHEPARRVRGDAGRRGAASLEAAWREARDGAAAEGMEGKGGCGFEEFVVRGLGRGEGGEDAAVDGSEGKRMKSTDKRCCRYSSYALATEGPQTTAHACNVNISSFGTLLASGAGAGVTGGAGTGVRAAGVGRESACCARSSP